MTNSIKTAFDEICAEESLKADTIVFLTGKIRQRKKSVGYVRKLAVALASVFIVITGVIYLNIYFAESAYVDIDVNPSVELSINRFDRVIGSYAYNKDGEDILERLALKHRNYTDAVGMLIDELIKRGYIDDSGLVSITLETIDKNKESLMLSNIKTTVSDHHNTVFVDAFTVDNVTRNAAHDVNLSPAKYLAITELQEVDPTATIENCREHSISEIKKMKEAHLEDHQEALAESGSDGYDAEYNDIEHNTDAKHGDGNQKTGHAEAGHEKAAAGESDGNNEIQNPETGSSHNDTEEYGHDAERGHNGQLSADTNSETTPASTPETNHKEDKHREKHD